MTSTLPWHKRKKSPQTRWFCCHGATGWSRPSFSPGAASPWWIHHRDVSSTHRWERWGHRQSWTLSRVAAPNRMAATCGSAKPPSWRWAQWGRPGTTGGPIELTIVEWWFIIDIIWLYIIYVYILYIFWCDELWIYDIVLYYTVLYHIVLYCIVCIMLYCIVLYYILS